MVHIDVVAKDTALIIVSVRLTLMCSAYPAM